MAEAKRKRRGPMTMTTALQSSPLDAGAEIGEENTRPRLQGSGDAAARGLRPGGTMAEIDEC